MDNLKDRLYNYEATPPEGVWDAIATELDTNETKVIPIAAKKNYTLYYLAAAAAVAIIVFCVIFFMNPNATSSDEQIANGPGKTKTDTALNNNFIMTVPLEEKTEKDDHGIIVQHKTQKEDPTRKKELSSKEDSAMIASNTRYITIEGPEGQPVKISSKMATLIDSSETKTASRPIWNKKISEWKEIMKVNTLAPTPGNFLDIIELTKTLRDNK